MCIYPQGVYLVKEKYKTREELYPITYNQLIKRETIDMGEEKKCCCSKTTSRSDEQKKKLLNRLKRIEGQVRGLQTMIENDAYCNDILIQSSAVSAAMNGFNRELLAAHIHSCVVRDIRDGKDEVVDELIATIQKLMK